MNIWSGTRGNLVLLLGCVLISRPASALLSFPLSANQRGTVTCVENGAISYDAYLPPGYSTTGTPLPIFYTLNPSGGGMVSTFQSVCSSLNIVAVGITGSKNGATWDTVLKEFYAVSRDIRQRVLFDPTAEFVGGFSGGADNSYVFSRFRAQHVAGVLSIGGWLGRINDSSTSVPYYSTDRVQTNLLVARITGTSDTGTIFYQPFDSNYLAGCGAVIKDWSISGGHSSSVPAATQTAALTWLINQRLSAGAADRTNAQALAANWQARLSAGQSQSVLYECVSNLMSFPRSWYAYQAQLTLDTLANNNPVFRSLTVTNLAQGDFASDLFYYYARGAATNSDRRRYYSALKALTGLTGTSGDRAGDVYTLLTQSGFPTPILNCALSAAGGSPSVWIIKDTPGLGYTPQARTNLVNDVWQDMTVPATEMDTIWSVLLPFDPASARGFFRVRAVPVPGASPPWPS